MHISYPHNPILPPDIFVPDAEAHVWNDGRLYLYGSFDIEGKMTYCSDRYHVYSTENLVDWVDHGVSFTVGDISWLKEGEHCPALYAPDCAYRNGKYYLYYCIPDGRCGVAVSDSPCGPFSDVGQLKHVHGIDPAVLIDDDGQAYLYWGQFDRVRVAKLKDNMVEIVPESAVQPLSVAEHEFHEGSSVKKINGKYYFLFTDTHRHADRNGGLGMATCLGYAVSDDPMTGFRYQGVIIDNFGCDPKTWNNHGSMVCFKGQWYIVYHRSTYGSNFSRHVCMEPIEIDENGHIAEVKMTSAGAGKLIPANACIPACLACTLQGKLRIAGEPLSFHHLAVCDIRPGDSADYRHLLFDGETALILCLCADGECTVKVLIDGVLTAAVACKASEKYTAYSADFPKLQGSHEVTLCFEGAFTKASLEKFYFG